MAELSLDQIEDWFNIHKTISKVKVESAATRGLGLAPSGADENVPPPNFTPSYRSSINNATDYAKEYQEQEERELKELISSPTSPPPGAFSLFQQGLFPTTSNLNQIDESSIAGIARLDDFVNDGSTENYKYYNFDHEYDSNLAITSYQEEIVNMVESNQVTVIQGATGCGKTTQVPQYILDFYAKRNYPCNIIVTQPRRIAAISIAKRVCHERKWDLGQLVGYQVGLEKFAGRDTRILYCTTGILLQKLINVKHMNDYTHIILDEVHERDQEMDFALLIVRKLLRLNSKAVKVILMSATFDVGLFTRYFSIPVHGVLEPAPTIKIKGQSFHVTEYYIEDLAKLGQIPEFNEDNPEISEFTYELAAKLVLLFDKIEGEEQIHSKSGIQRGTVLIFLPGLEEINQMDKLLQVGANLHKLTILPLHSSITSEEQNRVFIPPKDGKRKVILGTNIGESSITVSDIKFVIDFGLLKNLVRDSDTGFTSLALAWASKSNCIQRKGRAGRVSAGRVYRMVTRTFYSQNLKEHGIPEMQRCPLEQLILQVKLLNLGEPKAILGLALQPPNLTDIERNVLLLKEASALTLQMNGRMIAHDGDLTFIGRVLASLPLDIHLGKLLVLGHVFGCLEECLIIAASMSLKTIFSKPFKQDLEAFRTKMAWADGSFSDCIAALYAYRVWAQEKRAGRFHHPKLEAEWGFKNMIQYKRLHDVEALIKDLEQRLNKFNIRKPFQRHINPDQSPDLFILKLVLCGAFYPNYFVQSYLDENEILRTLNGHDPMSTVVISGLPGDQGYFYTNDIQELFKETCGFPSVSFENTKAYLQFEKPRVPGSTRVHSAIYLAVKLRQLRIPLHLRLLPPEEVEKRLKHFIGQKERFGDKKSKPNRMDAMCAKIEECSRTIPKAVLPSLEQVSIQFTITWLIDAGHFWAQSFDPENANLIEDLRNKMNDPTEQHKPLKLPIQSGSYCLAPYGKEYFRGKILNLNALAAEIFFVDYGNVREIELKYLYQLDQRHMMLPMQVFECFLSGLKPSVVKNHQGNWSVDATDFAKTQMLNRSRWPLYGQIHSIVGEELYLEVVVMLNPQRTINVNNELIARGFAVAMEDGLLSKKNYELRQACLKGEIKASDIPSPAIKNDNQKILIDRKSIFRSERCRQISLKGPTTPLEISFQSLLRTGRMRSVRIERESVNSVALEEEPQDHYARLMIASHVSVNPMGDHLVARNTTILPGIHGLPALMALVFCPTAEFRTDEKKKIHTGVLCGLGYDPDTRQPLFPDHDMEVTFDTLINYKDISIINSIRSTFNTILKTDLETVQWGDSVVARFQDKVRHLILDLWQSERKSIEPCYFARPYQWGLVDKNTLYQHTLQGSENSMDLFPLHPFSGVTDLEDLDFEDPE